MFCTVCTNDKSPDDFYRGVNCRCKDCHKAAMKRRRMTNPRVQEYDRLRYHTPERKEAGRLNAMRWRRDHPLAYKAQTAVNNAVRDGRLRKEPCAICGTEENVQGHHQDYTKPLDVRWLCVKCHHRIHAAFPELGGHYEARR